MAEVTTYLKKTNVTNLPLKVVTHTEDITCDDGDIIHFLRVKKGWTVYLVQLAVEGTGSTTVEVGDTNDDDRFITSTSTASSTVLRTNRVPTTTTPDISSGYKYLNDDTIILTIAGASVSSKIYSLTVFYTEDNNA